MGNEDEGNVSGSATVISHQLTVNNDSHRRHFTIFPSFMHLQKWINDTITTMGVDIYGVVTKVTNATKREQS